MRTYSERFTFSLRNDFHFSASILEASERRETGVNWTDKRYRLSDRPDRLAGDPHRASIRSGVLGTRLIRLARCGPSRSPNGTPCRQRGLSPIRNPDHDLCSMVEVTPRWNVVLPRAKTSLSYERPLSRDDSRSLRIYHTRVFLSIVIRYADFFFFFARAWKIEKYLSVILSRERSVRFFHFREIKRWKIQSRK